MLPFFGSHQDVSSAGAVRWVLTTRERFTPVVDLLLTEPLFPQSSEVAVAFHAVYGFVELDEQLAFSVAHGKAGDAFIPHVADLERLGACADHFHRVSQSRLVIDDEVRATEAKVADC